MFKINNHKTQDSCAYFLTIAIATLLLTTLNTSARSETFQAKFDQYQPNKNDRNSKIETLGTATLNRFNIPLYGVTVEDPFSGQGLLRDYPDCSKSKNCHFDLKISEAEVSQFKIIFLAGIGSALVPKNWNIVQSDLGASGTASAKIYSPDHKEMISIQNTGSCAGCSMRSASLYFANAHKQSLENEFGTIDDKNHLLKMVKTNKNKVYFSYQIPNYPNLTHGIAYYVDESNTSQLYNFQEIKVTLKPEHQSWAKPILNFYQATH